MFNLRPCIEVSIEPCTRAEFQEPKVEKAKKAVAGGLLAATTRTRTEHDLPSG